MRLASLSGLGIAKLQVWPDNPDAWFARALGVVAPTALTEIESAPVSIAWMAPGEWLVIGPETDVERLRQRSADAAGAFGLMVDITHGRTVFELSGSGARNVLAAHSPLDFGDTAMPVGTACRSLLSDAGFFISRRPDRDGEPCFRLIVDQTMADYAARMLRATISGDIL
ncbi:sarcosine oxidase subunit gamma [Sphingomonas sp. Root710]|uniref:sarcosine oxidase subunit gamma n=1 Tax=Sphingomonas sp. Root710 TaxID=1736594 RepID=UPI00138ECB7E|nr:sarcosine oxidase subunit gamma family protein [Sphingomonas sp. Root710]